MRFICTLLAVALLLAPVPRVARAEVRVQDHASGIRLEARQATVAEVFAALKKEHHVSIRGTAGKLITGTFDGSLRYVLAHVLEGYDYVIKHNGDALDVIVLGEGTPRATRPAVVVTRRGD